MFHAISSRSLLPLVAACFLLGACDRAPGSAENPAPAATAEPVAATPSPAEAAPTAPATPAILYAQMGNALGANGLLAEAKTEVGANDALFALAAFKGNEGQAGKVATDITKADGSSVYKQEKDYTVAGETPVVFEVKKQGEAWAAGDYKALFTCNGAPCWEVKFSVK